MSQVRFGILLLAGIIGIGLLGSAGAARAQDTAAFAADVVRLVNQERAALTPPLAPLRVSAELQSAAQKYAQYMGQSRFFSHTGPDGSTPDSRITAEGYRWTTYGENIAAGQSTPADVMAAWMRSAGHRTNILNARFTEIGVGCAVVPGSPFRIYWVQDFGARAGVSLPALPTIAAVQPARAVRGRQLDINGSNFGSSGSVLFNGGATGGVSAWSATRITVTVPVQAQSGGVSVRTSAGTSNVFMLQVDNPPPPPVIPGFAPRSRIAVFRPSTRDWFLRGDDGSAVSVQFGGPGDQPVPADYLGTGRAQIAVFRPSTQQWFIRSDSGNPVTVQFGASGDQPVPADYLGLGRAQIAVFRPSTQEWFIRKDDGTAAQARFGQAGDRPVPGDYLGLKRAQIAVFRPNTAQWLIRTDTGGSVSALWGVSGDTPVPADYFGLGRVQIAVYRPSTSDFIIRNDLNQAATARFGQSGDQPVPGDYNGIGRTQIAVFRPSTNDWLFRADNGATTTIPFGTTGDQPVNATFAFRFGLP